MKRAHADLDRRGEPQARRPALADRPRRRPARDRGLGRPHQRQAGRAGGPAHLDDRQDLPGHRDPHRLVPGRQGRRVWQSGVAAGSGRRTAAHHRARPTPSSPTGRSPLTVDTTGWVPGFYSFRLDADTGGQRYITLAVKSGDAHGKIVLLNGDTTWQAYNVFGGYSLYLGPNGTFATRARAVTFDRPYGGNEGAQGDGEFQVEPAAAGRARRAARPTRGVPQRHRPARRSARARRCRSPC